MSAEEILFRDFRGQSNRTPLHLPLSGSLQRIAYLNEDLGYEANASQTALFLHFFAELPEAVSNDLHGDLMLVMLHFLREVPNALVDMGSMVCNMMISASCFLAISTAK